MPNVNLKTLARQLNLSVSTVSKALNNSHEISAETKRRVVEAAKAAGYKPNPYAGFLRNQKSKTIALVVPELTNNFFVQAIYGAQTVAIEKGYHVLIYVTNDDFLLEEKILKDLQAGRVEGVIMSLSGTTFSYTHLTELMNCQVPIVLFDRISSEVKTTTITTDDYESGFRATNHLIEKGCRDIAFLSIFKNLSIVNKRLEGFADALKKYNLPLNKKRVINCGNNELKNTQTISQLLQSKNKPDGVFASVEKLALSTYSVCNSLNIKIPEELKVISFSNLRTASLLNPSLTTISQPAFEMGKQAAVLLFKKLNKKGRNTIEQNIVIKSDLIERDSTRNLSNTRSGTR